MIVESMSSDRRRDIFELAKGLSPELNAEQITEIVKRASKKLGISSGTPNLPTRKALSQDVYVKKITRRIGKNNRV